RSSEESTAHSPKAPTLHKDDPPAQREPHTWLHWSLVRVRLSQSPERYSSTATHSPRPFAHAPYPSPGKGQALASQCLTAPLRPSATRRTANVHPPAPGGALQ